VPGGDCANGSRLRVSEVPRAVLSSYGTSLRRVLLHFIDGSGPARLSALLRRLKNVAEVVVEEQESIPALCLATVQGCCRRFEKIDLSLGNSVLTDDRVYLLAGTLEAEKALPALNILKFNCTFMPDGLPTLARALASGSAPQLHSFYFNDIHCQKSDLNPIADIIEARARIPGCRKFRYFDGKLNIWFDRALLPT